MIGRIVGAILGYLAGRWLGALIGYIVGSYFDKGMRNLRRGATAQALPLAEHPFFATVFTLAGRVAKADGRISEAEIAGAERMMTEFGLSGSARAEAIVLFKRGASAEFNIEPPIARFLQHNLFRPELRSVLLEYLLAFALADNELHVAEREILQRIAAMLGFRAEEFARLLDMLQAQHQFHQRDYASSTPPRDVLANAYRALGVTADTSDAGIKKAYRRLMSQHHPDKLIAQGVPPDMVKLATEKTQEIQAAYELIQKMRAAA